MKQFRAIAAFLLLMPVLASAHEHQVFKIGDNYYLFTVGSLNEPVVVDDKSGVELNVKRMPGTPGATIDAEAIEAQGQPAENLQQTLKVEVSAGEKKKEFELMPQRNEPGSYSAVFFPTLATTLTYRFFGTIDAIPVDLTFTCNPAGHVESPEEDHQVQLSDKVVLLEKTGAFGCPVGKANMGFPEPSAEVHGLTMTTPSAPPAASGVNWGMIGAVLGLLGFIAGTGAQMRMKVAKSKVPSTEIQNG